ncbi:MAG: phage Gp37/Gp68 family protein [Bacillota bacterium]|nr:phage Gp37/Gp68 family protein [Bacillota bacterium]
MAQKSKIEWTENTWNPVTGCSKISEGCVNCYAERMANRLCKMGLNKYENAFDVAIHEECLGEPYTWKNPRRIFVNSMSDLYHDGVPLEFVKRIFEVMNETPQHTYQLLTKRAEKMFELSDEFAWTDNIWQGVTVESKKHVDRIDFLRNMPAHIKFISFEPLLEDFGEIDLTNIDWVIVGGESGWHARPMKEEWVLNIKQQCEEQSVLFYFKQWGGTNKKKTGRMLLDQTWDAMPELQIAEVSQKVIVDR